MHIGEKRRWSSGKGSTREGNIEASELGYLGPGDVQYAGSNVSVGLRR
jgi:hypothetical protein